MLAEQSNRNISLFFIKFSRKKKDSNKADAILIASYYYETFKLQDN